MNKAVSDPAKLHYSKRRLEIITKIEKIKITKLKRGVSLHHHHPDLQSGDSNVEKKTIEET